MKKNMMFALAAWCCSSFAVAQSRVVLIEQFTNSGCPPCAASSPLIFDYTDTNESDVVTIGYHTSFPYNDSMYFENPLEANARVAYYGVSGVPYSIVDGNYYQNASSAFLSSITSTIAARKSIQADYEVEALTLSLTSNQLTGTLKFTSDNTSNISDSLVAHIVVIERNVLKSSYAASPGANNESQYGYVMRKMLPNEYGTELINKTINGSDTINIIWELNHIKDMNEVRVVAFVQNISTREVYQARLFVPLLIPLGLEEKQNIDSQILMYPNPARDRLSIKFSEEKYIYSLKIFNQLGVAVGSYPVNSTVSTLSQELNLDGGIYYLEVLGENQSAYKVLIVD